MFNETHVTPKRFQELKAQIIEAGSLAVQLTSNSMAPILPTGAVAMIEPVRFEDLRERDIIVFESGGLLICHAVSSHGYFRAPDGDRTVITRGLAVAFFDEPIRESKILGRVTSHRISKSQFLFLSARVFLLARRRAVLFMLTSALIVAGAWLRFFKIAKPSFSIDESSSLFFSTYPEWRALFWDNHPPLYHLILKAWLLFAPLTEIGARSLSVVFSVVGAIALIAAGHWSGRLRRGFFAAFLLTGSCLSIRYAQEARMYAMFEALACAQLAALFYYLRSSTSRRAKLGFILSCLFSALTHAFGLLAGALLLPSVWRISLRRQSREILIGVGAVICLGLGFMIFKFEPVHVEWQRLSYALHPDVFTSLSEFCLAFAQKDGAVAIVMLGLSLMSWLHSDERQRRLARTLIIAVFSLIACICVGEWAAERRILVPRYFIFLNPFLIWLTVLGFEVCAEKIAKTRLKNVATVAALLCYAAFIPRAYDYEKQDWRSLAAIAVEKKAALVLSTRPKGFGVPYYSSRGIAFDQFDPENSHIMADLKDKLKKYHRIMIVDDNLSRLRYHLVLELNLNEAHIAYETFDLANAAAGSVFGILLIN